MADAPVITSTSLPFLLVILAYFFPQLRPDLAFYHF